MSTFRILILDDDIVVSEHLGEIVQRVLGSDVLVATSVAEAKIVSRESFDFALLDVDVLDGTTYEFASYLNGRGIPFAFVSASDSGNLPSSLRAVPFVRKPYDDQQIVALLREARK